MIRCNLTSDPVEKSCLSAKNKTPKGITTIIIVSSPGLRSRTMLWQIFTHGLQLILDLQMQLQLRPVLLLCRLLILPPLNKIVRENTGCTSWLDSAFVLTDKTKY